MVYFPSDMDDTPLDVFFRGRRTYIQGSLILTQAAEWLRGRLGPRGAILLQEAGFTSLVDVGVRASLADGPDGGAFGSARFLAGGSAVTIRFTTDAERTPPRLDDSPSQVLALAAGEGLGGEATVALGEGFGGFLSAVVEADKRLHEGLGGGVHDIWFSGLRKAAIPTDAGSFPAEARLVFTGLMQRRQGAQRQSLSRVEALDPEGRPIVPAFVCTFAYKL